MSPEDTIVKGFVALALYFDRSTRTVRRWAQAPDFPRLSGRRFDVLQVQAWLDARQGLPATPPASRRLVEGGRQPGLPEEDGGKDYWDRKAKEFQAKSREMEYRQRRGELVSRQEVDALHVARSLVVKQGLLSLARALPPQLIHCRDEREMEILISKSVRELLEEFSRPLPEQLGAVAGTLNAPDLTNMAQVEEEEQPRP